MAKIYDFPSSESLSCVESALAEVSQVELYALIKATHLGVRVPASLFEWIEAVCDWELDRRVGLQYPLAPPYSVIPAADAASALQAAASLRLHYGAHSLAVYSLFEAILDLLTGNDLPSPVRRPGLRG